MHKKCAASIAVYVVALFIIGVLIFTVLVLVFNVNFDTLVASFVGIFRTTGGTEPVIRGALFQCEIKCSIINDFDSNSLENSSFCKYFIEINGTANHCYLDHDIPDDVLVYNCIRTTREGEEIIVNDYC